MTDIQQLVSQQNSEFYQMKTLSLHPSAILTPSNSRGYSFSTLQKRSETLKPSIQCPNSKQLAEEEDFVQRVSKKYLYFHQSPNKNLVSSKKTISFPYTAINLCYFEKNFTDIKEKKLRKNHNFNTNNDIKNYLNMRLKTEPISKKQFHSEQQIFVGKKMDEKRMINEQNLKQKILFSIENDKYAKNSPSKVKPIHQKSIPKVLKIKSKKAYFLGRMRPQKLVTEKSAIMTEKSTQKSIENQEVENGFELKYRSRTEDNISMINEMRMEIRTNLRVKERKREKRQKKEESFEPWEVNTLHGSKFFQIGQNYY